MWLGEQVELEAYLGERVGAPGMKQGYSGQVEELGNKGTVLEMWWMSVRWELCEGQA